MIIDNDIKFKALVFIFNQILCLIPIIDIICQLYILNFKIVNRRFIVLEIARVDQFFLTASMKSFF